MLVRGRLFPRFNLFNRRFRRPKQYIRTQFDDFRLPSFPRKRFNFLLPFFRNFGDTLEDCREVERRDINFCSKHPSKELFEFRRPVSGICNNLLPGKATVGAADTQVARLVRKYC